MREVGERGGLDERSRIHGIGINKEYNSIW